MTKNEIKLKKLWYKEHRPDLYKIVHKKHHLRKTKTFIKEFPLPVFLDFLRWVVIDIIRRKKNRIWGIYQFVALPGEGKTMSMVHHIQRMKDKDPRLMVFTNFNYKFEDGKISHWIDMIRFAKLAREQGRSCILAIDEIHITFDSADWQNFPPEMLALLSFNRKYGCQFICSSQIYERIPKKVRDIANYSVICKNVWQRDRLFVNYFFTKSNYDDKFAGKKSKAEFLLHYVASDKMYSCYDTLEQVDNMMLDAKKEKDKRVEAFDLLYKKQDTEELDDLKRKVVQLEDKKVV